MANSNIVKYVEDKLQDVLKENGLILYHCQFVKEGRDWFLRVFIDCENDGEYVSISQCEEISKYLSRILDEDDVIEQNYYLEVSSPGLDRQLIKPEHFKRYEGHLVRVKLYKAFEASKEYVGTLGYKDDNGIMIIVDDREIYLTMDIVAKVNLEVVL